MTATPSTRLTITRNLPTDVKQRQVYVTLDGEPIGTMLFGDTITQEIPPGSHRVRANNTLVWKTIAFEAAPGEHVQFVLANRTGRWSFSSLALIGVGPLFLTFERAGGSRST